MKLVYIIANIDGLNELEAKEKYETAKLQIREFGYEPISPYDYMQFNIKWNIDLRIRIKTMLNCDFAILTDPVQTLAGNSIEYTIANWISLQVIRLSKV